MSTPFLSNEAINSFIEEQLAEWPLAAANHLMLGTKSMRRILYDRPMKIAAQWNPARIVSSAAAVDAASIAARKCFLCSANRPSEQFSIPIAEGWEMLLNPYPILPVHFTFAAKAHTPQAGIPAEMIQFAESAPSLVIFFNGAQAGASAPDHLHLQGVLKSELPLMRCIELLHTRSDNNIKILGGNPGIPSGNDTDMGIPYGVISLLITPDSAGMKLLSRFLAAGEDEKKKAPGEAGKLNAYCWMEGEALRIVILPRRCHRPSHYFRPEDEGRILVSPGAIDMAGLLILPRKEDFDRITLEDALAVYRETGISDHSEIKSLFPQFF